MQANDRLQRWNSKGLRPEGWVEAAARDLEVFRGFKGLKTAGLNALTTEGYAGKRRSEKLLQSLNGWATQKKQWMWPWGSFCLRGWAFRGAFAKF